MRRTLYILSLVCPLFFPPALTEAAQINKTTTPKYSTSASARKVTTATIRPSVATKAGTGVNTKTTSALRTVSSRANTPTTVKSASTTTYRPLTTAAANTRNSAAAASLSSTVARTTSTPTTVRSASTTTYRPLTTTSANTGTPVAATSLLRTASPTTSSPTTVRSASTTTHRPLTTTAANPGTPVAATSLLRTASPSTSSPTTVRNASTTANQLSTSIAAGSHTPVSATSLLRTASPTTSSPTTVKSASTTTYRPLTTTAANTGTPVKASSLLRTASLATSTPTTVKSASTTTYRPLTTTAANTRPPVSATSLLRTASPSTSTPTVKSTVMPSSTSTVSASATGQNSAMDRLKRYGAALKDGMYDDNGIVGLPGNSSTASRSTPVNSATRVAGGPGSSGVVSTHGNQSVTSTVAANGTGAPATRLASTSLQHAGTGLSGSSSTRRLPDEGQVGYWGENSLPHPRQIEGLSLDFQGKPISVYEIPADPHTGTQRALTHWGGATISCDGAPDCIDLRSETNSRDRWSSANIYPDPEDPTVPNTRIQRWDKQKGKYVNNLPWSIEYTTETDSEGVKRWKPITRQSGPAAGDAISTTSLHDTDTSVPLESKYVDQSTIPGVSVPVDLQKQGVRMGDPAYVYDTRTGNGVWAVVADSKGKDSKEVAELSEAGAKELGIEFSPKDGSLNSLSLIYTYYPSAGKDPKDIHQADWQPSAISNTGQLAAYENGFKPEALRWFLPQPAPDADPVKTTTKRAASTGTTKTATKPVKTAANTSAPRPSTPAIQDEDPLDMMLYQNLMP
jgi:hypothetical protein